MHLLQVPNHNTVVVFVVAGVIALHSSSSIAFASLTPEDPAWHADKNAFRVIASQRLNNDPNWLLLTARRLPDPNVLARRLVAEFEARMNARLPFIYQEIDRAVYNAEAKVNQQYDAAERQLESTVQKAAQRHRNARLDHLQHITIPTSINAVNKAVNTAQVGINRNVHRTEDAITRITQRTQADVNDALPQRGADVLTPEVRDIVKEGNEEIAQKLQVSAKQINRLITNGNKVVDANIAKVETEANAVLPKRIAAKVTNDIKEASEEIDDSIAEGRTNVVAAVRKGADGLKKMVPELERGLKGIETY